MDWLGSMHVRFQVCAGRSQARHAVFSVTERYEVIDFVCLNFVDKVVTQSPQSAVVTEFPPLSRVGS